jgi:succinyl-CoA synthetase alpha subunit
MTPELMRPKNVIVQGITGSHGGFHTNAMLAAGTNIIAGTSPNKTGVTADNIPIYKTIEEIKAVSEVDASVIFVPAAFAKGALLEAIDAGIPLIVCITEGIPVHDMITVKNRLKKSDSTLIGPNCPGYLVPRVIKAGIIPEKLSSPGSIGIVSRSGTLTYELMASLTRAGIGQQYVIGIGGDPVHGTTFNDCLALFEADPNVTSIALIGEIGGQSEQAAASYITSSVSKPVYGYIAGHHAPKGVQLGHAGAILGSDDESASAKTAALDRAGVTMSTNIFDLVRSMPQTLL